MLLQTTLHDKFHTFEVIPLSDLPNSKIFFFVQIVGGNSALLEKRNPGGVWIKVKGGTLDEEVQQAICDVIDGTSAAELWKDLMPLDEFDN